MDVDKQISILADTIQGEVNRMCVDEARELYTGTEQLHKIMHVKVKPERILMVLTASEEE